MRNVSHSNEQMDRDRFFLTCCKENKKRGSPQEVRCILVEKKAIVLSETVHFE